MAAAKLTTGGDGSGYRWWDRRHFGGTAVIDEQMFRSFSEIPREHTIRPFWFWNGPMTPSTVERQIEAMVRQHVYGAYVHCRSGLRPRYLSDDFWSLIRTGIAKASEVGFEFCVVDEYNWPSGEARDYTRSGYPSRVLERNEAFRMRSLVPSSQVATGPAQVEFGDFREGQTWVVAGQRVDGALDARTLVDVTRSVIADHGRLVLTEGTWSVYTFRLQDSVGFDGGLVDLLNPEAVRAFIEEVYEKYAVVAGEELGRSMASIFLDHEGDYGYRMAWTPALFATFEERRGYPLAPVLPLLLEDGGPLTPKVRCDWFDTISELYTGAYFEQLTAWGRKHGLTVSGHVWEESLRAQAAFVGDHFRVQRAMSFPTADSVFEWGHSPRHLKEAASVAHFEKRPFAVENQGVQGADSYLSLERIKRTTNILASWGVTRFVPHALNSNADRIDFPEDWFERQPWWDSFHEYADYAARLSFMNSVGRHVCEIVVYYPIETAWANGEPIFIEDQWNYAFSGLDPARGPVFHWGNVMDEIDVAYDEIIEVLPAEGWDLDIADAHYLRSATCTEGRLRLGDESFGILILPPMTAIRRSAAERLRAFHDGGVRIIAVGRLATDSAEQGRDDPAIAEHWESIFGLGRGDSRRTADDPPSNSVVVADPVALVELLEKVAPRGARVVQGEPVGIRFTHRWADGRDYFWCVNDNDERRRLQVDFPAAGRPWRWDPVDGSRAALVARNGAGRTTATLDLAPSSGCYVVFEALDDRPAVVASNMSRARARRVDKHVVTVSGRVPATGERAHATVLLAGAELHGNQAVPTASDVPLGTEWHLTPEVRLLPAPHGKTRVVPEGTGEQLGFPLATLDDAEWPSRWLSSEQSTIRDWMILGPFDYDFHRGYNATLGPEADFDPERTFAGRDGILRGWRHYESPGRVVDLDVALGTTAERVDSGRWITAFAHSWLFSTHDTNCQLRVTADSNVKAWLNGAPVISERDDHHAYLEMRDAFGVTAPITLAAGWNGLLLKVSQGLRFGGNYGFAARVCDSDGVPTSAVEASAKRRATDHGLEPLERWYRIPVPAGATGVRFGRSSHAGEVWADGHRLSVQESGQADLRGHAPSVLGVRLRGGIELKAEPVFELGGLKTDLRPLQELGWGYYAGTVTYEQQFVLPPEYEHLALELDLGRVGTVAEAWINGRATGRRVWSPYVFDVTGLCRTGVNTVRIRVANSAASERARGDHGRALWDVVVRGPDLIKRLDRNGLEGPVILRPYCDVEFPCA